MIDREDAERIGAEADEGRMAEADQPGIAEHDVQPDGGDGVGAGQGDDVQQVGRQQPLRDTDHQRTPTGILRVYEHRKTGEVFLIRDPDIPLAEVEAIQNEVFILLENHGRPPEPQNTEPLDPAATPESPNQPSPGAPTEPQPDAETDPENPAAENPHDPDQPEEE